MDKKICVHTYRTRLDIDNSQEQLFGFSDFLRGTEILVDYCNIFNYDLQIDKNSHHLFKYFKSKYFIELEELIKEKPELKNITLICSGGTRFDNYLGRFKLAFYDQLSNHNLSSFMPSIGNQSMHEKIIEIFEKNKNFSIVTNAFEINDTTKLVDTSKPLSDLSNDYLKSILNPCDQLSEDIENIYKKFGFDKYEIIHLRFHDDCIINFSINDTKLSLEDKDHIKKLEKYFDKLDQSKNYVLVSNSKYRANYFIDKFPFIKYHDNENICHLGFGRQEEEAIYCTLIDLFLITRSQSIHSYSYYMNSLAYQNEGIPKWKSGFSYFISKIYDIPYELWEV